MRGDHEARAFRNGQRVLEYVERLPVEVVFIDLEQRLAAAVGVDDLIFHVLAAHVHVREVVDELKVARDVVAGRGSVALGAGRNQEERIDDRQRLDRLLDWLFGEDDADARAVFLRPAGGLRVMHLQDQVRSGGYSFGRARRIDVGVLARGVGRQDGRTRSGGNRPGVRVRLRASVVHYRRVSLRAPDRALLEEERFGAGSAFEYRRPVARFEFAAAAPGHGLRRFDHLRRFDEDDCVVHDALVAGTEFGGLNPLVFGEVGGDAEVDVIVRPARVEREFFGHRKRDVRLADPPGVREIGRGRQIFRVAFLRATVNPPDDRVDLALLQPRVVREFAVPRIGAPWRHLSV